MQMIQGLQINNYKSIRQVNLSCSKINVFIGEPNVGKSNILEALDLTYLSSFFNINEKITKAGYENINIKEYFRVNKASDLFHLGDLSKPISVIHPGFSYDFSVRFKSDNEKNIFQWEKSDGGITAFNNDFEPEVNTGYFASPIKPYRYKGNAAFHDIGNYLDMLMPPFGNNLVEVIKHNPTFLDLIGNLIKDYGFELNINTASGEILIQLRINKGVVYSLPWKAMAETLKRFIFYIAVIRHNNAHIVTLEEPEVHSFPKYISSLADEIIQAKDRQFFIATHSPYLLNNLIENTPSHELSVFVCGYNKENFETTVKKLSDDDLSELLNFGVDIFFNINRYADNGRKLICN